MKKSFLLLLLCAILVASTGCSKKATDTISENNFLKGELSEIVKKTYEQSGVEMAETVDTVLNAENQQYFIGSNDIEYLEGLASEPMMSSSAHSVVLLRVKEGADIEKIKEEIKTKVDPRKWICVGVEPENVIVDHIDNVVILIMNNESAKLHEAFKTLAK